MSVSPDLMWSIIRNNSSFILKGSKQTYSRVRTISIVRLANVLA